MATTKILLPGIGALWQQVLTIWDQYANGAWTSFAFAFNGTLDQVAYDITVGVPAGGTNTFTLISNDINVNNNVEPSLVFSSAGWRAVPNKMYQTTLPDGANAWTAFKAGPMALRANIITGRTGSLNAGNFENTVNNDFNIDISWRVNGYYNRQQIVTDAMGLWTGVATVDVVTAYATDFIGSTVPVAAGGSGSVSVDLTPIVTALNNIGAQDYDFSINNGSVVFSLRSRSLTA